MAKAEKRKFLFTFYVFVLLVLFIVLLLAGLVTTSAIINYELVFHFKLFLLPALWLCLSAVNFFSTKRLGNKFSLTFQKRILNFLRIFLSIVLIFTLFLVIGDVYDLGNNFPFFLSVVGGVIVMILFPGFLIFTIEKMAVGNKNAEATQGDFLLIVISTVFIWIIYGYLFHLFMKWKSGKRTEGQHP